MYRLDVNCFLQKPSLGSTLFDFSSNSQTKKINKTITSSCNIYKENNNISISKDLLNTKDELIISKNKTNLVGIVSVENEKYSFKSINTQNWLLIKEIYSSTGSGFQLHEGDLISFGNVKFRINEFKSLVDNNIANTVNKESNKRKSASSINHASISVESNSESNTPQCRICLSKSNSDHDPLISPCLCSGSVQFIHLKCLNQWFKTKIDIKDYEYITMVTYQECECELCKTPIPSTNIVYLFL